MRDGWDERGGAVRWLVCPLLLLAGFFGVGGGIGPGDGNPVRLAPVPGPGERHRDARDDPRQAPGSINGGQPVHPQRNQGVVIRPTSWDPMVWRSDLYLRIGADWCTSGPKPRIHRVSRVDHDGGVVLTVYVAYPWPSRPGKAEECLGVDLLLEHRVPLEGLAGAPVYDGSKSPPVRKFPK